MKAVIQTGYGSADVMELREIEKPTPGDGEVLVRVLAASLAAGEYFGMRGKPFPIRMYIGFPKPKKDFVVGLDCAGQPVPATMHSTLHAPMSHAPLLASS